MNVHWIRCQDNTWCRFHSVNLDHVHFDGLYGIYIIWYWNDNGIPTAVKVGKGIIRDELKKNREYLKNEKNIGLYATWTTLPNHLLNGVENYLIGQLQPAHNITFKRFIESTPVNLPWEILTNSPV